MSQTYGIESPAGHVARPQRKPVRYLVIIEAGGSAVAKLLLDTRQQVGEFDAGAQEVIQMTQGLMPTRGAEGGEWDVALQAHSSAERRAADVYVLDV